MNDVNTTPPPMIKPILIYRTDTKAWTKATCLYKDKYGYTYLLCSYCGATLTGNVSHWQDFPQNPS